MWSVYICGKGGFLYTGITTEIKNRLRQHKKAVLLYVEEAKDKIEAARREKEIKGWSRAKKLNLIHSKNNPVSLP